jgi:hypothetical protein
MRNAPSNPAMVDHVCPTCGPRTQAPPSYSELCRCGKQCFVDVSGWMATALEHYPTEDPIEVAVLAGIPAAQARAALDDTEAV